MTRRGMVIDLQKCATCYNCVVACKQEHFLPPLVFWNRVVVSEAGKFPTVTKIAYPVLCNHCKEAVCVKACPTGATHKREDGIVEMIPDQCVGCRYCVVVCPYQQRTYHAHDNKEYFPGQGLTPLEIIGKELYPLQKGTVIKCNFCAERVDQGVKKGLKPGVDREATPACVIACPCGARYFGDLDDPKSEVSKLIKEKKAYSLHLEYGTEPSVFYINR
jgi:molybdopterin-containing oxidoreductase family iron-sulfur binding subunit